MLRSLHALEAETEDEMLEKAIVGVARTSMPEARWPRRWIPAWGVRSCSTGPSAGREGRRLDEAFDRIAYQLERLDALRRQVRSAMTYPAVVFGLALVVMIWWSR